MYISQFKSKAMQCAGIALVVMQVLACNDSAAQTELKPEQRLLQNNIVLPAGESPIGNYVPYARVGNLLYVSGHGPSELWRGKGKLGSGGISVEQGYQAARDTCLRLLGTVRSALGSLDKVKRVIKTNGSINSEPSFADQPKVLNGCSDLMVEVFGPTYGKGARAAIGVEALPYVNSVEVEMILEVTD